LIRRLALLAAAAALYVLAAWQVAPGFYDGFAPPQPYNWVSPPPGVQNPGPPQSGQVTARVTRGVVDPGTAFTNDGQAMLSWIPGAFQTPASGGSVTIQIKPVRGQAGPPDVRLTTNIYQITATQPLVKNAVVTLRYSDQLPAPTALWIGDQSGTWRSLGSSPNAATYTITSSTSSLGYFAAGFPADVTPPAGAAKVSGGQLLPILVAAAILLVVLAGVPLALLRRRSEDGEGEGDRPGRG
jgi:hypothetical protein